MDENEEFEFRLRMEREQVKANPASAKKMPSAQELSAFEDFGQANVSALKALNQHGINLGAGLVRGAGSIGATLLSPIDAAARSLNNGKAINIGGVDIAGHDRRTAMDAGLRTAGAQPESMMYGTGKLAGEIAGTAGAGGVLGQGVVRAAPVLARAGVSAPAVANMANALTTGGMRAGTATGTAGMATRIAGGAAAGGLGAGMINPGGAGFGAVVGGALPPVLAGVGKAGRFIGNKLAGPVVAPEVRQAVEAARAAGYVMPPTQAKPSLANRALEGFAGKITTAQNASAKNQPITNELARKAIGAADLSEAGIAQVRAQANRAYDALGQVGKFQADAGFTQALDDAAAMSAGMRANFPELVNNKVDDLITSLKSRPEFDAQPTIEAIKQFRADAATNKIALDPAQKALGRAQAKIAGALEDLVERNLTASGNPQLLDAYRAARQTLAKTYQVEKALNKTSGNIDGNKLAQMMQKGKPMTGDLRTIADFAARFPKANQTVERMGSLPGVSPLDFGAMATTSAVTGNPLMMAGVLARPAARSLVLSGAVQNRLAQRPGQSALNRLMSNEGAEQLLYRSAPAISAR